MSLERFIKYIRDGEPVSAGTANRPTQQLDQNIRYLWDIIQAANLGSTVYARSQTVKSDLAVGQPVYFNSATARFEKAYATTSNDSATGYLTVSDQAQVWGIVAVKHNATLADILLFGFADIDISAAIGTEVNPDGSVPAATWYLSGSSSGQLTRQTPPVTIPVCKTTANGSVFVNPSFVDFLENHRHYVFELEMLPAGDVSPPVTGNPHTIINADNTQIGWLPADDAIFNGLAPAGAVFGYNISQDSSLYNAFPPVPLQSVCVLMQRPSIWDASTDRTAYSQQLESDTIVVNRNGIWWMTDCYDRVPWPTDLDTNSSVSDSYITCDPAAKQYSLKLYYVRVSAATDNTVVSSLRSLDSRLQVLCDGLPATTGNLELDLNLSLMLGRTDLSGYTVIKNFDTANSTFESGPVAEGLYTTSSNVLLTSTYSQSDGSGNTVHYGPVGIGVLNQATQELQSQLVRLDGVTEENYPVLYLGMPDSITTSYVVKFEIPADAPSSVFQLRLRILGRAAGTLPQLTASYYTAGRPVAGLATPLSITQSYTSLSITTVATVTANQAVEALSSNIAVTAGDIVYIKIQRTPADAGDTYAGELGIMQQVGVLTST
jgi:hypothetical protein